MGNPNASLNPLPLTPTLSLRERETRIPSLDQSERVGLLDTPTSILPLPGGEGQSEGEKDDPKAKSEISHTGVRRCSARCSVFNPMKKRSGKPSRKPGAPEKPRRFGWVVVLGLVVIVAASMGLAAWNWRRTQSSPAPQVYVPRPRGQVTFTKDIAPIVFQHCAGCHRPGQPAPFVLLSYLDVKKHATDVADVTARRYMPPWLPEHGYGEFVGERRLNAMELGLIQQWVTEGAIEGAPGDLPRLPTWSSDWQLGRPDMVVTLAQPYTLAAEGRDVYRNFVIPVPVTTTRYVKGVELHPGNLKVVHHAFIRVDSTPESRRLDAQDPEAGFGGMNRVAKVPGGHLLGWQPGRLPAFVPEGLAWRLDPGTDLVIEMHMNPKGKPEQVQPGVGFYFTDQPPTNTCYKVYLTSYTIDISAGTRDYVVQDSYTLPVDVQALAVLPHAHYLGKEMQGWATLPDGTKKWLIFIKQWDFNWQSDYRYSQPIFLPKGTTLSMRFTYDNSTNNVQNPSHPPKPITYGPQSSDEMAELWVQLLPRNQSELSVLERDFEAKMARLFDEHDQYDLRKNPNDAQAHADYGLSLYGRNRLEEAEQHFRASIRLRPDLILGRYGLGLVLRKQNRLAEAITEFDTVLRLDPKDFKAHGNLGFIYRTQGDIASALAHFESALRLNPDDALAREGRDEALRAKGRR